MPWIVVILAIPVLAYAILIGWMIYGQMIGGHDRSQKAVSAAYVSVVIPARNEAAKIKRCLESLIAQEYPPDKMQIIVVNDASEDETEEITKAFIAGHQQWEISLTQIPSSEVPGQKKRALARGISEAKGRLILTTDADVVLSPGWVGTMVACHQWTHADMVAGPVQMTGHGLFGKMQALEFAGLTGFGESCFVIGHPTICNGASLAFTRDAFDAVCGYHGIDEISSGDDVLLMQKMLRAKEFVVSFAHHREALVWTEAEENLGSFVQQRVRWASKSLRVSDALYRISALLVLLSQLSLLIACFSSLFFTGLVEYFGALLTLKLVVDFLFLFLVTAHYGTKGLMWYFLPGVLYNMLYIPVIGLMVLRGKYYWKGRQTR